MQFSCHVERNYKELDLSAVLTIVTKSGKSYSYDCRQKVSEEKNENGKKQRIEISIGFPGSKFRKNKIRDDIPTIELL